MLNFVKDCATMGNSTIKMSKFIIWGYLGHESNCGCVVAINSEVENGIDRFGMHLAFKIV